ncbi:hypothetical protein LTR84_010760 [Exophiala bonariae]|uniref:Uncharacterized protein n=1 Tax=Exophiala bonariae TaxID=1690606 RepID=A0AAV9MSV0_9EURO|nr:hypothetical protein LTR84_010760 [Exophiala bonariae]
MPRPSLPLKLLQGTLAGTSTSVTGFLFYTRHCEVVGSLDQATEPLFDSHFFHRYNPHHNHVNSDIVARYIPLTELRRDLLEDSRNGGSKLVEHFCGAMWSGWSYTPQRLFNTWTKPESSLPPPDSMLSNSGLVLDEVTSKTLFTWSRMASIFAASLCALKSSDPIPNTPPPTTQQDEPLDLWDPSTLSASTYPIGTSITNSFLVLFKTPTTILVRCGSSPLDYPYKPRTSDGLFEISAVVDFDQGCAEFKIKSLFYNGTEEAKDKTMGLSKGLWWLHEQYAKLLLETSVRKCRI